MYQIEDLAVATFKFFLYGYMLGVITGFAVFGVILRRR